MSKHLWKARNKFGYTPCKVAEDHLQFHISKVLKKLLSGSGVDLSYLSEFSSSNFEESAIPGMRNAGTTANVEASSASFRNYPNRASNSGHGSGSDFALDESSVNVLPRTDPPPTELEEIRTTLTGLHVQWPLSVPFVPRTSHNQDSGIRADLSSRAPESLVGDNPAIETNPDDSNNSLGDATWLWYNFPNAMELEYSHNPEQEYEHTSLRRSRQLMSGLRRSSC
ncbi:hypothetical protein EV426DRAFT_271967 [Tirmania nivea]|nr:hypothetical protein EV426DRAFT_271967 [Tirmania nivea]